MQFIGYVKKISVKSGKSPKGKAWTKYSGIILEENGAESGWLSFGFDAPPFTEGDYAEVTANEGQYGLEVTAAKKLTAPQKAPQVPAQSSAPANAAKSAHVDRNDSIVYQSSRKDALTLVALLLEHDALPMTGAATKAAVAKRYEEIKAFVDKLTVEFFHDVGSLRVIQQVVDSGAAAQSSDGDGHSAPKAAESDDA